MSNVREVSPSSVEKRLVQLSKELDEAHTDLVRAESDYFNAKADLEIVLARTRMELGIVKMTVQEKEDRALLKCKDQHYRLAAAEAVVRAARANSARLRTQVDIARSVGTSVRSALDLT